MNFALSKCRGIYLHKFDIVGQYENAVEERCTRCAKQVIFKTYMGKTDNNRYLSFHARQALPKAHNLFEHEYGIR